MEAPFYGCQQVFYIFKTLRTDGQPKEYWENIICLSNKMPYYWLIDHLTTWRKFNILLNVKNVSNLKLLCSQESKVPRPWVVLIRCQSTDVTLICRVVFFGSICNGLLFEQLVVRHDLLSQGSSGWMIELQSEELVKISVPLLFVFSGLH